MDTILVTGGTGTLGREVVGQLLAKGLNVAVLTSREQPDLPREVTVRRGDLAEQRGLKEATEKAGAIIHCASNPLNAEKMDIEGTKALLEAVKHGSSPHFIYISIVGTDQSEYPYYRAKTSVENMIRQSGLPWSILRTTQFHNFVLDRMIYPMENSGQSQITVPSGIRFQSVDIREVAGRLTETAEKEPTMQLEEMGGPEVLDLEEMARTYVKIKRLHYEIVSEPPSGRLYGAFRSGINICRGDHNGKITWEKFLRDRFEITA